MLRRLGLCGLSDARVGKGVSSGSECQGGPADSTPNPKGLFLLPGPGGPEQTVRGQDTTHDLEVPSVPLVRRETESKSLARGDHLALDPRAGRAQWPADPASTSMLMCLRGSLKGPRAEPNSSRTPCLASQSSVPLSKSPRLCETPFPLIIIHFGRLSGASNEMVSVNEAPPSKARERNGQKRRHSIHLC